MRKRKSRFANIVVTPQMVEESIRRHNFWRAFEKLCERLGKTKEFFWYARGRDNSHPEEKKKFLNKMTRLLAFNYDVHRRPDPIFNKKLYGDEPLTYPPDWSEA